MKKLGMRFNDFQGLDILRIYPTKASERCLTQPKILAVEFASNGTLWKMRNIINWDRFKNEKASMERQL